MTGQMERDPPTRTGPDRTVRRKRHWVAYDRPRDNHLITTLRDGPHNNLGGGVWSLSCTFGDRDTHT